MPADWEGTGQVRGIAVDFASGIDQAQLSILEHRGSRRVMQNTSVRSRGADRRVGRSLRTLLAKLVQQLGLELVFAHSAAARLHHPTMRVSRDVSCPAHRR